jgi:hypothetical protein
MAKRREVVTEQLDELRQDLEQLWDALTRDPKQEARKQRNWNLLLGISSAAGTMVARKLTAKTWSILTGEQPPTTRGRGSAAKPPPTQRTEEETREPARS